MKISLQPFISILTNVRSKKYWLSFVAFGTACTFVIKIPRFQIGRLFINITFSVVWIKVVVFKGYLSHQVSFFLLSSAQALSLSLREPCTADLDEKHYSGALSEKGARELLVSGNAADVRVFPK